MYLKTVRKDAVKEVYEVIGRNRTIVISSNRPNLRSLGLKHKRPVWKVDGGFTNASAMEHLFDFITPKLDEFDEQ